MDAVHARRKWSFLPPRDAVVASLVLLRAVPAFSKKYLHEFPDVLASPRSTPECARKLRLHQMDQSAPRSLKYEYDLFVENEIEAYKESISRTALLKIGDEAVASLQSGMQLGMNELLLVHEVDKIIRKRSPKPHGACSRTCRARPRRRASRRPASIRRRRAEVAGYLPGCLTMRR